jgi:hypothetical protein
VNENERFRFKDVGLRIKAQGLKVKGCRFKVGLRM